MSAAVLLRLLPACRTRLWSLSKQQRCPLAVPLLEFRVAGVHLNVRICCFSFNNPPPAPSHEGRAFRSDLPEPEGLLPPPSELLQQQERLLSAAPAKRWDLPLAVSVATPRPPPPVEHQHVCQLASEST